MRQSRPVNGNKISFPVNCPIVEIPSAVGMCGWSPRFGQRTQRILTLFGEAATLRQNYPMKTALALGLVLISTVFVHADWTTDYKAALVEAKTQNKLILLDFTGSDWCGFCQLLDKEVLSQQSFKDFADKRYILVTVDFPHQKQLPEDLAKQNDALKNHFKIEGYPTLLVLDAEGHELGRQAGYGPGIGPKTVISILMRFNKK